MDLADNGAEFRQLIQELKSALQAPADGQFQALARLKLNRFGQALIHMAREAPTL